MRYAFFLLWMGVVAGWLSCVSLLARRYGGYQFIAHVGLGPHAAMVVAVATLCMVAGVTMLTRHRLSIALAAVLALVAAIHLAGSVATIASFSTEGSNPERIKLLFVLLHYVPTTTQFIGMPFGVEGLCILPIGTIVLLAVSLMLRPQSRRRAAESN